ncbi:MAG TPA: AI-2E family transporter, partial [Planctomycetaceae bacterium]|nr:AI-2E family transporter [Planctomycetaceae bacterium]
GKGDDTKSGQEEKPSEQPDSSEEKPGSEGGTVEDAVPVSQDELVKYAFETATGLLELSTMALFYLLFALVESRHIERRIRRSFSSESAARFQSVIDSLKTDMRSFLWIKTLVSAGLGVTTAILGWLFGLDFWLMWGCLIFLSNYITYIGSMVALVPMVLLAIAQFESTPAAAGLSALLILNRLVWIDYAEMRYSGKYVDVSPLLILFSVALMGWIWGVVGMLLAVPLITTGRIILDSFPRTRFLARLISDVEQK